MAIKTTTLIKFSFGLVIVLFIGYLAVNKIGVFREKITEPVPRVAKPTPTKEQILRDSIVTLGMKQLGRPYVYAGNGEKGFDCSGFVYFVYQHFGVDVPRSSAEFEFFGEEIPVEEIKKGDILLFLSPTRNAIGHIGIALGANGENTDFIHASSGREMKVIISSFASAGYKKRFVKAIRVL